MPIMITPTQYVALEARQLQAFAAEVARTLEPLLAGHRDHRADAVTVPFATAQLDRARRQGLGRRNEMMAWTLCAAVHGDGFEHRLPEVAEIVAERHYDRSMLLTLLALRGLRDEKRAA